MKSLSRLFPYQRAESVFSIDYRKLYQLGFRGIIFDLDQTLVPHGEDSTVQVDALFEVIRNAGIRTLILSNNSEQRVLSFLANIDSLYIHDAHKPEVASFLDAVDLLGVKASQVVVIGDQLLTDVLGANRAGLASILVKYLHDPSDRRIGKRRRLEQVLLGYYQLRKSYQNRIGAIHVQEA